LPLPAVALPSSAAAQPSGVFLPDGSPFRISAVLFDFDGTLTRPGLLDFAAIRQAVGCPPGEGLLEFLASLEDEEERRRREAILVEAEREAAGRAVPGEGAETLITYLRSRGIPLAIITRNAEAMVETSLERLGSIQREDFALVITRDSPVSPKPLPDGVMHAAEQLGVPVGELLVIGDHEMDIEAGRQAGALTMLLRHEATKSAQADSASPGVAAAPAGAASGAAPAGAAVPADSAAGAVRPDFTVNSLAEALWVIRHGLPLPAGKLPADLLAETLNGLAVDDPSLLVGAAVGEDAAALDVEEAQVSGRRL
jgi:HAD superfamily hydrolase (TIGR01509 family)